MAAMNCYFSGPKKMKRAVMQTVNETKRSFVRQVCTIEADNACG